MRLAVLALVMSLAGSAARADELLAVLPLDTAHAQITEADRLAVEEMLRTIAANELQSYGFTVLTGQNTLRILEDNGVDVQKACEANCALEAARELKARAFLSGSILTSEGTHLANIRLFDSATGKTLASTEIEGASVSELRQKFRDEANSFFRRGLGTAPTSKGSAGRIGGLVAFDPTAGGDVLVKFSSNPPDAVVFVDGQLLCQKTPCSKVVRSGVHEVTMQREGYEPVREKATFAKDANVRFNLAATFGSVELETVPPGLRVRIDEGEPRATPRTEQLAPGLHAFVVDEPCYAKTGERVEIERATTRRLLVTGEPLAAGLRVIAEDPEGNAVDARVFVDGEQVGTAPGTLKVGACAQKLEVRTGDGLQYFADLSLKANETTTITAKVRQLRSGITLTAWIPSEWKGIDQVTGSETDLDFHLLMDDREIPCRIVEGNCVFENVLEGTHTLRLREPRGFDQQVQVTGSGAVQINANRKATPWIATGMPGAVVLGLTGLMMRAGAATDSGGLIFFGALLAIGGSGLTGPGLAQLVAADFDPIFTKSYGDVELVGDPKAHAGRLRLRLGSGHGSGLGYAGFAADWRLLEQLQVTVGTGLGPTAWAEDTVVADDVAFGFSAGLALTPPRGRPGTFLALNAGTYGSGSSSRRRTEEDGTTPAAGSSTVLAASLGAELPLSPRWAIRGGFGFLLASGTADSLWNVMPEFSFIFAP